MRRGNAEEFQDLGYLRQRTDDLPLFSQPVGYQQAGDAGLSADQCAATLGLSILAIRPRVTELFMAGKLVKTDRRVTNDSGLRARVLRMR